MHDGTVVSVTAVCIIRDVVIAVVLDVIGRQTLDAGKPSVVETDLVEADTAGVSADITSVHRLQSVAAFRRFTLTTKRPQPYSVLSSLPCRPQHWTGNFNPPP